MSVNRWKKYAGPLVLATLAWGCRDETSKDRDVSGPPPQVTQEAATSPGSLESTDAQSPGEALELPEPLEALEPVATVEPLPPLGPPPFVLREGSYLLSGRSLPEEHHTDLEDFLASAKGSGLAQQAGLLVSVKEDVTELLLSQDLALAFQNMGQKKPLTIKTQGHNLTLVGHTLKNLNVITTAPGQKSGDVEIIAVAEVSGAVDVRGARGSDGADGECPPGYSECARISGLSYPAVTLKPEIERQLEEESVSDVARFASQLGFYPFQAPTAPLDPLNRCVVASTIPMMQSVNERLEGSLVLRRSVPRVSWPGDHKGQSGWASPGAPGTNGQDAGKIKVTAPSLSAINLVQKLEGGPAGSSGRPGIVGAAPAPVASALALSTEVELNATGVSKVYEYSYRWHMKPVSLSCGRFACPPCSPGVAAGEQRQGVTQPIQKWSEPLSVPAPETQAGEMPALVDPPAAASGANGRFERSASKDLESVTVEGTLFPLNQLITQPSPLSRPVFP